MERAYQPIEMKDSAIEQVCRQYFKDQGSLKHFELLSGGAVNTTFKILWENKFYVLRFYVRDHDLVDIEKSIYQKIHPYVPIPELLFSSSEQATYPFAIFPFYAVPHLYEIPSKHSHTVSYDLGKVLSGIHHFQFPVAGLFGKGLNIHILFKEGSSPYLEYCLEHLTPSSYVWRRLGDPRARAVIGFMQKHREYFPVIERGGSLVHSDFKPVNLLWEKDRGAIVLDWEFAHSGHGLIDFGILLRHFRDFPLNIEYLEKGYRENGGVLPFDWIQRARITDFVNVIQLLETPSDRPHLFKTLIESVDFTMGHWDALQKIG